MRCKNYDGFIQVKLKGCTVYLLPEEINRLLLMDRALFVEALKRGKAFGRNQYLNERIAQKREEGL